MDFSGPIEAALSTDLRGEPYNFALWDIHTGTQLVVFKGVGSSPIPKCLQIINNNYFITANDKVVHVWSIYNKKCQDTKLILPGRASTLCVSPCGNYLIVAISEMMYIWQLHSGILLAKTQRHYQTISVLRMDSEGAYLFSGSEDGMVLVWPFASLISKSFSSSQSNPMESQGNLESREPRFTWQHHSAQVTDVYVTNGGRCLTSSTDSSINLYSYRDGKRLYCIHMPSPIWSIVMDKNETFILAGAQDGNIYETATSSLSLSLFNHEKDSETKEPLFTGHKGKVTHMAISLDGTRLVTASVDASCKIWDIHQRKMLLNIKHQAPLANLCTLLVPESLALTSMSQSHSQQPLSVKQLKRDNYKHVRRERAPTDGDTSQNDASTNGYSLTDDTFAINNSRRETNDELFKGGPIAIEELFNEASTPILYHRNPPGVKRAEWPDDIEKKFSTKAAKPQNIRVVEPCDTDSKALRGKIRELYKFAAEKIFKDAASESLHEYKDLAN